MKENIKIALEIVEDLGLTFELFGNPLWRYLVSILIIVSAFFLLLGCKRLVCRKLGELSKKKEYLNVVLIPLKIAIEATNKAFILVISLSAGISSLTLPPSLDQVLGVFISSMVFFQIGLWLDTAVSMIIEVWTRDGTNLIEGSSSANLLKLFARAVAWVIVLLLLLGNVGVDVTGLVAGLGIGGIALALAVQSILGDLLCSLSIALDEPFEIGDFLVIDTVRGTVEKIGIKSTRLRSLSGEQIIVANSDLVKGRIQNFKRMQERRIAFKIGVTYQTSSDTLASIPSYIQAIIESTPLTRFDRCHFISFGDSSLLFDTVFYVLSADYSDYADAQQKINLEIFKKFESEKIEFAYPTQTLFIEGFPEASNS